MHGFDEIAKRFVYKIKRLSDGHTDKYFAIIK